MKKNKTLSLLLVLLVVSARSQELKTNAAKKPNWSVLYFAFYDPDILLNHSFGFGIGSEDVRISTGFSFGKNLLGAKYNYSVDDKNYFDFGDFYGAFFRPEADIFRIGNLIKLSGTCLLNYSNWNVVTSFQRQDSLGALTGGNKYFQKTNSLDFFYGLNADIRITKNLNLGAGVLIKFFSCYAGQVSITDYGTNTSDTFKFGYNGPNDHYNRWFYPSAFIRYELSFQR